MASRLLNYAVNNYLADFVKEVDMDKVNASLLSTRLELTDLELKEEIFERMDIPLGARPPPPARCHAAAAQCRTALPGVAAALSCGCLLTTASSPLPPFARPAVISRGRIRKLYVNVTTGLAPLAYLTGGAANRTKVHFELSGLDLTVRA